MKPTVCVKYKSVSSEKGLTALLTLSPLWAIWAPGVLLWMALPIVQGFFIIDPSRISLALISVFLIAVAVFALFVCLHDSFQITEEGIKFPTRFLLELKSKLFRPWSQIKSLEFIDSNFGNSLSENPNTMQIMFTDGSKAALELSAFTNEDLQSYMLALQSHIPDLPVSPALPTVNLAFTARNAAESAAVSFTQIWEDDMASRFGSTVFIPLEPGALLQNGRLQIVGQVAFGGLSAIYLAKNTADDKLCVIKEAVIPRSCQNDAREKALELFKREATILMKLNHERIASVFDYFVENNHNYIALEYVDGKDLRKYISEKGPQNELTVLRWAIEISEILSYLHSLEPPVVHRDLTPDNLLLEADGSITLIDFGAANEFIGVATGTVVGKQSYISPEQFRGKATPASDYYSLGASLSYLLTGKDPEALSVCRLSEICPHISSDIESLIIDLTSLSESDRLQSATELRKRCQLIIDSLRSQARTGAAT
jgi:tRNA A-37 threonylcarbamoyl transferase component Bud32